MRASALVRESLCLYCAIKGRSTAATVRDHVQDHHGDHLLFWSQANHASLCASCHVAKSNATRGAGTFDLKAYEEAHAAGRVGTDYWNGQVVAASKARWD